MQLLKNYVTQIGVWKQKFVRRMTAVFASLTSKSYKNDTSVYVDNYVEMGDFFLESNKNRHRFRIFVKTDIATQVAKKPNRSILLCEAYYGYQTF